jgi:hypothetical protein
VKQIEHLLSFGAIDNPWETILVHQQRDQLDAQFSVAEVGHDDERFRLHVILDMREDEIPKAIEDRPATIDFDPMEIM